MHQSTAPSDAELRAWLAPEHTALLVIDMQADFASPDGAIGKGGVDMGAAGLACAKAELLAEAARKAGAPVIFVGLSTRPETDSPAWREWRRRMTGRDREDGLCRQGTRGADFFLPRPQPQDAIVWKLRYSGFFGTSLDAMLRARRITTLVVSGLTTECCVDSTIRDAFHLDYHVFVVRDACAAYDAQTHETALANMELNFCMLLEAEQVISGAWRAAPPAAPPGAPGRAPS